MSAQNTFLPYGRPNLDQDDVEAVVEALQSDFLTTGPRVKAFELALSDCTEAPHAVVCNSGTAALHLAYMAIDLTVGDQIIVPAMTFAATANAAAMCGADVIFADCDPETGLLTADILEEVIKEADPKRLKAVSVVHMNGQIADIAALQKVTQSHGLHLIEDACHAVGSSYVVDGKTYQVGACAHSDLCCFSFHPVKNIAMGEGGAVTTDNANYAQKMSSLRNHGQVMGADAFTALPPDAVSDAPAWHREMHHLGYNYRVPDILCALGTSQLKKLNVIKTRKTEMVARYDQAFVSISNSVSLLRKIPDQEPCWHLYPLLIDFEALGIPREGFMAKLRESNVGTQVHYMPVHLHPYWQQRNGAVNDLPNSVDYYFKTLSLPLYYGLSDKEQDYVIDAVSGLLK